MKARVFLILISQFTNLINRSLKHPFVVVVKCCVLVICDMILQSIGLSNQKVGFIHYLFR